jgi:hypothetical protein
MVALGGRECFDSQGFGAEAAIEARDVRSQLIDDCNQTNSGGMSSG